MRDTTHEEKRKILCSARGCKNVPIKVEETKVTRRGSTVSRVRFLCSAHLPKMGTRIANKALPKMEVSEVARELECELPRKPWLSRLLDWL